MRERIQSARLAVLGWSRTLLALQQPAVEPLLDFGDTQSSDHVDTVFGNTGLVMTPAQAPAFFARSNSWRCTSCGKVHFFARLVPVAFASPCTCASIEFEPQREIAFIDQGPDTLAGYLA